MEQRRRYIAFRATGSYRVPDIYKATVHLYRKLGADRNPLRLIHYDGNSQKGLFLCNHRQVGELRTAIENLSGLPLRVLGVSGTIRAAKTKYLLHAKKESAT